MTMRAALRALRRNKLRSALTTLGIVIGVAAVIAMVSIGRGANVAVQQQIASLGTNLLMVIPGATTSGGVRSGWGGMSTLSVSDATTLRAEASAVAEVTWFKRQVGQAVYRDTNWSTSIQGVTPSYSQVRQWGVGALACPAPAQRSIRSVGLAQLARVYRIVRLDPLRVFNESAVDASFLVLSSPPAQGDRVACPDEPDAS